MAELRVGDRRTGADRSRGRARHRSGGASCSIVAAVDVSPGAGGQAARRRWCRARRRTSPSRARSTRRWPTGEIDAVALTTTSRFSGIIADLETAIRRRVHVASTCEELAAPAIDPQTWARLDDHAQHSDVTLLGTGVNPGFVMDRLPLQLAGACVSVARVRVDRVVDAAKRRGPLRKKVGEGLTPEEFRAGVAEKRLGHVGLRESALLIARGLGWKLESYEETIDPVVGDDGKCLGIRQRGTGIVGGVPRIELALDMYVGAPNPHDRVQLESRSADRRDHRRRHAGRSRHRRHHGQRAGAHALGAARPRHRRRRVRVADGARRRSLAPSNSLCKSSPAAARRSSTSAAPRPSACMAMASLTRPPARLSSERAVRSSTRQSSQTMRRARSLSFSFDATTSTMRPR